MANLRLDSLSVSYGDHRVLSGIHLQISEGDVVGILGRNGSGKTALFRALLGHIKQSTEVVKINGTFIPKSKRWKQIAYLPQASFLPNDYTVDGTIKLLLGKKQRDIVESNPRIGQLRRQKIGSLSGGERRLLELLLIASLSRPYILLDEPFSQMEPKHIEVLHHAIQHMSATAKACVITDHNYRSVMEICSRLAVLVNGRLHEIENKEAGLMEFGYIPYTTSETECSN